MSSNGSAKRQLSSIFVKKTANRLALYLLHLYKSGISPWLPHVCRFYPSCSHYASESFQKYSFGKAMRLTIKRLLRCHPFCEGGFDPVPEPSSITTRTFL